MKKVNILYWVCTSVIILAMGIGSIPGILGAEDSVKVITSLGYPEYLVPFLSIAKVLGVIAILIPKFPRLKEWAYAGLAFDVIGANYSLIAMGTEPGNLIIPVLALIFLFGSYFSYHKKKQLAAIGN
jgi:uncharacterized membrane protein YphA (DoxX/SURF4 family)